MLIAHKPLQDPEIVNKLFEIVRAVDYDLVDINSWSTQPHVEQFCSWIKQGSYNTIVGLESFPYAALCAGTSDAISTFIARNNKRRIRFSRAEFTLSKIVCNSMQLDWAFLEDADLEHNDAVVVSFPFSGNGRSHPSYNKLITTCERLQIPVCVDAAYLGIGFGLHIVLTSPCITDVTVSLSKPFSTMLRHGIRFTRIRYDDTIQNNSETGILPRINVVTATELMKLFPQDYIITKYHSKYQTICHKLNLMPTNTITLASGTTDQYSEFVRGSYVRICLTDELLS